MIFSAVTGYMLSVCFSRNISSVTPRKVYAWFFTVYRVSVVIGLCGYIALLIEFFGLGPLFMMLGVGGLPFVFLWYGLYFGILGRDCAEVAFDWIQVGVMGGRRSLSVVANRCGICSKDLRETEVAEDTEQTIQLDCKHSFHEFCIRGWTLVGKKDVCPTCGEKVDLNALYVNRPWETSNLTWIKMLDALRYLIVWNPLIFIVLQFFLHSTGYKSHHSHQAEEHPVSL